MKTATLPGLPSATERASASTILFGFIVNGDFVAVDTETHAAERAYRGSEYWRKAKADPAAAAKEMIESTLALRAELPDMPSHQPATWDDTFAAHAQLMGSWIAVNRATGESVMETFEFTTAAAVNRAKYDVLTAYDYLTGLNRRIAANGGVQP